LISNSNIIKKAKWTWSIQEKRLRRRRKQYKEIIKAKHQRSEERNRPREKEKSNELLNGPFFVLELSIVTFPPQAPQKETKNHLPHNRTPRTTTRSPTSE
jgi:hypothetical protein